jgi:hypothetical protein
VIEPDDKDWTWVIERPCPECGFVAADHDPLATGASIRANAATWVELLGRPDAATRTRTDRWSVLEYGAHVRDVLVIYRGRLGRMLTEADPLYENWDQDATAVASRYGDQDARVVSGEVADAADALATDFDTVPATGWDRPGRRSDGASFTVASFSRYLVHDLVHHVWDVTGAPAP